MCVGLCYGPGLYIEKETYGGHTLIWACLIGGCLFTLIVDVVSMCWLNFLIFFSIFEHNFRLGVLYSV